MADNIFAQDHLPNMFFFLELSGAKENQLKHSESTDSSEVDDITSLDYMHTQLNSEVDYKLISTPVVSSEAAPVCFQCFAKETIL